jgi:MFS transporter, PHS family, inorganic phosphate transporter
MSGIIAAEFVATQSRGTTIAAVFLMQSIGRLLAFGFGNAFLQGQINAWGIDLNNPDQYGMKLAVDQTWRFVAGFGGVFAIIAIALRLTIPESPRYHTGIARDLVEAMEPVQAQTSVNGGPTHADTVNSGGSQSQSNGRPLDPKWIVGSWRYIRSKPAWKPFVTICCLWFMLDVCFYGTGLDSPSTLNLLWVSSAAPSTTNGSLPLWENDPLASNQSIYNVLFNDGNRALEVSSISSLVGSLAVIPLINFVSRRNLLLWTSAVLAVIFLFTGGLVLGEYQKPGSTASRVFYALAQFVFNLGPNTVVFVLAAEIFPTMFRGTLFGLAAASGKAGAMFIRPFVQMAATSGQNGDPSRLAGMLFAFAFIMMAIAGITWFDFLPAVQDLPGERFHRLTNRHLEDIAPNPRPGELARRRTVVNGSGEEPKSTVPLQSIHPSTGKLLVEEPIVPISVYPGT